MPHRAAGLGIEWLTRPLLQHPERYGLDSYAERLAEISEDLGIHMIDLTEPMRLLSRQGEQLYFLVDGHLSPAGHAAAARLIIKELEAQGLQRSVAGL